ncbi:hypothetical protein RY831_00270 [Noviherbaspirillum sp. CPCC 100848]|uniref:Uncharacterized protein n=1 Tax=Noviherbaspirillum album TaxID=3080276 RepID=A0ABU6J2C8_9BURK|nr:hypothetical protein [Noviherbaspirillum sp. CPCC 100848]MEC4717576.1 hypothetical protein [Noviherbaspirillum sp. CPCC 100848]
MSDGNAECSKVRPLASAYPYCKFAERLRSGLPSLSIEQLFICSTVRLIIRACFGNDCGGRLLSGRRNINAADFRSRIARAQFGKEKNDCAEKDYYREGSQVFENVLSGFHA